MKDGCGLCARYRHSCQFHRDDIEGDADGQRQRAKQCGAKTRSTGNPCLLPAGWGTEHSGYGHCRRHCGNTAGGVKAARKVMAEAAARFVLPRHVDAQTALIEEVWRSAGWVAWLDDQVTTHDPEKLAIGEAVENDVARYYLRRYDRERRHLADVCATAIRCGIADRQVRIAKEQGRQIATVLRGVLSDLGLSEKPELPKIVKRHILLVSGREE